MSDLDEVAKKFERLAFYQIESKEKATSEQVLKSKKVAIFVVAYNAEKYLESVVKRIPPDFLKSIAELFIIDDSSTDNTFQVATELKKKYPEVNINAYRTPFNRGYGGNQKLGYLYCINKGYDIVVLLHGDGQYAPEYLPRVISAFDDGSEVVFASRMLDKKMALKGGMPLYKWLGNQVLTRFENKLLGTNLSEFHTGFSAYSVQALAKLPFIHNSDDFHFDTEIIIQSVAAKLNMKEVAIPTYYGDEVCHVSGMKYAKDCVKAVIKFRLVNLGLYYQRNFDFSLFETDNYQFKTSPHSLHQYVLKEISLNPQMNTIELGSNRGFLSARIAEKVHHHIAVDLYLPDAAGKSEIKAINLNSSFSETLGREVFDACIALDVVEHMNEPEAFLVQTFNLLKVNGRLYMSTANVAYIAMRLSLLLGQFNYGKRGILDKTHHRLFTIRTMSKMLEQYGFEIEKVVGFAPPISDMIRSGGIMGLIEQAHTWLSKKMPNLFSYNFLVVAKRRDDLSHIFSRTIK